MRPRVRPDWIRTLDVCWISRRGLGGASWGCNMSCFDASGYPYVDVAGRTQLDARFVSAAHARKIVRLMALVLAAASLAACAQSSVVSQRSDIRASRQASLQHERTPATVKPRVAVARKHTPFASKSTGESKVASQGIASFYSYDTQTA